VTSLNFYVAPIAPAKLNAGFNAPPMLVSSARNVNSLSRQAAVMTPNSYCVTNLNGEIDWQNRYSSNGSNGRGVHTKPTDFESSGSTPAGRPPILGGSMSSVEGLDSTTDDRQNPSTTGRGKFLSEQRTVFKPWP
jgi:hypothetical protein